MATGYFANHHHYDMSNSFDNGYDSSSDGSLVTTPWEAFDELLSPFDYAHSMSSSSAANTGAPNTPHMDAAQLSRNSNHSRTSSHMTLKKEPGQKSPTWPTSAPETEEERRKNRKREQNRESQRAFRRRQENRVKFLEGKTLELETNSRQLRAENEQLRVALVESRSRNDELVAMMQMASPSPLQLTHDMAPEDELQYYTRHTHTGGELDPRVVW